jgi:four helix bundle protein
VEIGTIETAIIVQGYVGTMQIDSAKDLNVYKLAYNLAMEIFEATKHFPSEEKYALTSQIRRSSRSICLNLREAWAKRRYEAHFISKLTDCDGENSETESSLDFARDCRYISAAQHRTLTAESRKIGGMLGNMIKKAESFIDSGSALPKSDL